MPLLSLVPPSPWSVFPLFLWRGCWHLPPVSAAPSPAPGAALEQGKDPLVCTKTTRKGQGPKELFWIYFPAVFAWATGWSTWNLPWNRVKCAGWENMFSPRSQCSVRSVCTPRHCCGCWYKHMFACMGACCNQHDFSTTSRPQNSPKNLLVLINDSISAAQSLSNFFFAHSPYRPEMWQFIARYFYLFLTWMALRTFVYDLAWGPYLINVFLWPLGTKGHF